MRKAWVVALCLLLLGAGVALVVQQGTDAPEPPTTATRRAATSVLRPPPQPVPSGTLSVRGTVRDVQGQPAPGIEVSATRVVPGESLSTRPCTDDAALALTEPECGRSSEALLLELVESGRAAAPLLARTTTGADGTFTLDGLPEGPVTLWALGGGERGTALKPDVTAGAADVDLRLQPGRRPPWGRVLEESGAPLPGARVVLFHTTTSRTFELDTGEDGRFVFDALPDKGYSLAAFSPGLLPEYVSHADIGMLSHDVVLFRPRRVTGRVLSGEPAAPVPGVEVHKDDTGDVTVTDAQGRFTFESLPPIPFTLRAEHDGLEAFADVGLDETRDSVDVELTLGGALGITGTVRDDAGQPIVGARVTATRYHAGTQLERTATTDAEGRYRLASLPPGGYSFDVTAEPYQDVRDEDRDVGAANPPQDFTLARAFAVEGTVTDAEGRPRDDVLVRLEPLEEPSATDESETYYVEPIEARTDKHGRFLLEALEPGRYAVQASNNLEQARAETVAPSQGLHLVLPHGATVRVTVVNAQGRPARDVRVFILEPASKQEASSEGSPFTDGRGRSDIGGIPPGTYQVVATRAVGGVRRRAEQTLVVTDARAVEVTLRLETGPSLSGIVVDDAGRPVPDASLLLMIAPEFSTGEGYQPAGALSGPDGRFTMEDLPTAPCRLHARREGYAFEPPMPPDDDSRPFLRVQPGGEPVRVVMRYLGRVTGRLVREDGAPVTRFRINEDDTRDPRGAFTWEVRTPGHQSLRLEAPGLTRTVLEVEVPAGQDVDLGEVVLKPGREVRGRIRDSVTGEAVPGATVGVGVPEDASAPTGPRRRGRVGLAQVPSDSTGAFVLPPLEERPFALTVQAEGFLPLIHPLGAGDTFVDLRLSAGARVSGTVRDRNGRPLRGTVLFEPLRPGGLKYRDETKGGAFVVPGMEPGDYVATVLGLSDPETDENLPLRMTPQHLHLEPDARRQLDFVEPPAGNAVVKVDLSEASTQGVPDDLALRHLTVLLVEGFVPFPATRQELEVLRLRQVRTDEDLRLAPAQEDVGRTVFNGLTGGHYTLFLVRQVSPHPLEVHREEVDIPAEATSVLRPRLAWRPAPEP